MGNDAGRFDAGPGGSAVADDEGDSVDSRSAAVAVAAEEDEVRLNLGVRVFAAAPGAVCLEVSWGAGLAGRDWALW